MPRKPSDPISRDDPLWYKDAVIYELHVRAFSDSTSDGIGDFAGLTEKLDYLQDLGITAIWLLPFYPSPWRDDGYDIADYGDIHAAYGTMADFRSFLREAHSRGLRVITELVINHTSDQHPWFQRARRARSGSAARDFYVWSDSPERYRDARIIFKDFESSNWSWDSVAQAYFWHRFYSHQPDLNFDNPAVHKAILKVMDFWFRMGVDGMRLDAIPYLYEREGTNCENLPETHGFLRELRAHLDASFRDRMFLAEANQWPEETVPYFGEGDECHMGFHFPVMPRLFMAIHMEDRFPIIDILNQTPPIPDNCQWATFLRNHDELTLEMVTDEERDYMYRMYASDPQARINLGIRRRLAPLLGNNRRKIELMNALLFSLPGTPVLYYGDELGMGDNIYLGDRNGVRTPMQWSPDRNAGFSRANPQRLYLPLIVDPEYHYETVNVEAQQANLSSLYWWTRRLIALRKRFRAFGRGSLQFVSPENRKVLSFLRTYEDEQVLVVANLSRFVQYASLDLSGFRGSVPVELFGRTEFPPVRDDPYFLTLGPHSFYWFELQPARAGAAVPIDAGRTARVPVAVDGSLKTLLSGKGRKRLEAMLPEHMLGKRWFQGKARQIRDVNIEDTVELPFDGRTAYLTLLRVDYVQEMPETYAVPLMAVTGARASQIENEAAGAVIAPLRLAGEDALLFDALADPAFREELLDIARARRRIRGSGGDIAGHGAPELRALPSDGTNRLVAAEQTNSSIIFGERAVLKLYRRLEDGINLDLEIGRFLSDHGFHHTPRVLGSIEYRREHRPPRTIAVIQEFVSNEGDAWALTQDHVRHFLERATASGGTPPETRPDTRSLLRDAAAGADDVDTIGAYAEDARILGRRTAEMHVVLASEPNDPAFAPEAFTMFYQRSLYQSMRNLTGRVLQLLSTRQRDLPDAVRDPARHVLDHEQDIYRVFRRVIDHDVRGLRIRCHGDLHLGQVLYTGNDFIITDFEGEPIRPLGERRLKRSPLRDVAGMLRSFHYAANATLLEQDAHAPPPRPRDGMADWARFWYARVAATYLRHYFATAATVANLLPPAEDQIGILLDAYLLEKAVYELGYELNNRPDWAIVPLRGIIELLQA